MQNKYNYKSKFDMVWKGLTEGSKEADRLRLGKDWRSWSPLHNHIYQVGILGGVFACVIAYVFDLLLKFILRQ